MRFARQLRGALASAWTAAPGPDGRTVQDLDLLGWGRRLLPEHFRLPPSRMHLWLAAQCDRLRRERKLGERGAKVNVLGPRGGAKSTLVTLAHVLRAAVQGEEPYIWIISDTAHQAAAHLANVRAELVDNQRLAAAYPGVVEPPPRGTTQGLTLANGVRIEAWGTGQKLRGKRHGAFRPTLIVCDDLQNDGHIRSRLQRERSRAWFHGVLLNAGSPRTSIIHLATALHRQALALELHATAGWRSRSFAAIERWPNNMPLWAEWESLYADPDLPDREQAAEAFYEAHRAAMDEGAVVLWPEEEDLYSLMRLRADSGRIAFEREKQNVPVDPEECEWPEDYFGDWIWFDEWPGRLELRVIALDPSKGSDSRTGDYSAFVLLGVDAASTIYVDADLARRPTPQIVAAGVELVRRFQPHAFGVETNQFQELLAGEFERAFAQQGLLSQAVTPLDNTTPKQVRIRRLGPLLSSRRLRFKSHSVGARMLVDQLREFPMADHDDGPDAAEMALRLAELWRWGRLYHDGLGDRLRLDVP